MRYFVIFLLFISYPSVFVSAQGNPCSNVANQILCADTPYESASLEAFPFTLGCFDYAMTNFYTFETGSNQNAFMQVAINYSNCDYIDFTQNEVVNDSIFFIVAQLTPGANPCLPSSYSIVSSCEGNNANMDSTVSGLSLESEYVLIVGSNHDNSQFGPCAYDIAIGGPAVDLTASASPFNITLCEGADAIATGASSGSPYSWSPEPENATYTSDSTFTFYPSNAGETISLSAVSTIGSCTVNAPIYVHINEPIYIYNALTPNGDGYDDFWEISGLNIPCFEAAEVSVYDRWGQLIFRSLGYQTPWDGTNRGKFLPTGPYYYVIEPNAINVDIEPYIGIVSIIR